MSLIAAMKGQWNLPESLNQTGFQSVVRCNQWSEKWRSSMQMWKSGFWQPFFIPRRFGNHSPFPLKLSSQFSVGSIGVNSAAQHQDALVKTAISDGCSTVGLDLVWVSPG